MYIFVTGRTLRALFFVNGFAKDCTIPGFNQLSSCPRSVHDTTQQIGRHRWTIKLELIHLQAVLRIRFILFRIRPKIEKYKLFWLLFLFRFSTKIICYCIEIENIISKEKHILNTIFLRIWGEKNIQFFIYGIFSHFWLFFL